MTNQSELTLIKACEILGKSKRTITRYIKRGLLNPDRAKNEKGILEYRFKISEIENIKNLETRNRQTTRQNQKVEIKNNDTLLLLKDTMKLLQKQLKAKDIQIKQLLDRQRETNVLMGQLQNRVLLLEDKSKGKRADKIHQTNDTTSDTPGDKIINYLRRLFGKR